jgi:hypothetical protein
MTKIRQQPSRTAQNFAKIFRRIVKQRRVVTYGEVAQWTNLPAGWTGRGLGRLYYWCEQQGYPPITSLVVRKDTKLPGSKYPRLLKAQRDQRRALRFDWSGVKPPTPAELDAALCRARAAEQG